MLFIVTKDITLGYVLARAHVENMQIFQHTNELNIDCWTDKAFYFGAILD